MLLGLLMVWFGAYGLALVAIQRILISAMPAEAPAEFVNLMNAVHSVLALFLPFTVAGGAVFAISGWFVYRGSEIARRIAQANALAGYVWVVAYCLGCYRIMPLTLGNPAMPLPQEIAEPLAVLNTFAGAVLSSTIPTVLLVLLSRPRRNASRN